MKILLNTSGPVATNSYLVVSEDSNEAVAIDVPPDSFSFFTEAIEKENLKLQAIWLTHSHWDHIGDVEPLKKKYNVPVYLHKEDEYRTINPNKFISFFDGLDIKEFTIDKYLEEGDVLALGDYQFDVIHTPGHTEGGVCFVNSQKSLIFVGDTLFHESVGRTDLQGGNYKILLDSIQSKLFTYDDSFTVLCGHGPPTTIGHEKQYNPFIQ